MAVMTDIRDELIAAVGEISVAANYRTDNVNTSTNLATTPKLNPEERLAHFGCRWILVSISRNGNAADNLATYRCRAAMDNQTDEGFANFIEDIATAIFDRKIQINVDDLYYGGAVVESFEAGVTSVIEDSSDRIHEASIQIQVSYKSAPERLSGPVI